MSQSPTVFLVVEDEPADAEFIQHAFAAAGRANRILLAANGEEAVAHLIGRPTSPIGHDFRCPT